MKRVTAEQLFKGKKITVFGLGLLGGGVGVVKYLSEHGAKVIVTDIKSREQLKTSLEKIKDLKNITYALGQHRNEDFTHVDMVVKNPSIPWKNKYIQMALAKKIPVETDASLFFQLCPVPVIGVTGTKGKTTTAYMIAETLRAAGTTVVMVGTGQVSVLDRLRLIKKEYAVVFELSSWRLSSLGRLGKSPHIAVWTNFFPDHMNYYKTLEGYFNDKKCIFSHQTKKDFVIYPCDDPRISESLSDDTATAIGFGDCQQADGPRVYLKDGMITCRTFNGEERELISPDQFPFRGDHLTQNAMAAMAAAYAYGIKPKQLMLGLQEFKGVRHRLEVVSTIGEIEYINDTTATVPQSTILSIQSQTKPVVLIAGGSDKKVSLEPLIDDAFPHCKNVILLKGKGTETLLRLMKDKGIDPEDFPLASSMEEAVALATERAEKGDVVLLSPGTASFGMFVNEFDRGEKFVEAVKQLITYS